MRYVILGRPLAREDEAKDIRQRLYREWKDAWGREFQDVDARLGREFAWRSDAFLRQDYIAALIRDEEIVCLHSYTLHDLSKEYERDKSYLLDTLGQASLAALRARNLLSFMSMENFIVMPGFRHSRELVAIFDSMVCLGVEFFHEHVAADAIVTLTRNVKSINKFLVRLGFRSLLTGLLHNGEPADLMIYDETFRKEHKRPEMERSIRELWAGRTVLADHLENLPLQSRDLARARTAKAGPGAARVPGGGPA